MHGMSFRARATAWLRRRARRLLGVSDFYEPFAGSADEYALIRGPQARETCENGLAIPPRELWLGYGDCGLLALYADGEPEQCEQMLEALRTQAREVNQDGIRPDEVQRVTNKRRTHLALEGENPRTRLMQLIDDLETHGYVRTLDARLAAVEAVSTKTIAKYLERFPITGDGLLLSVGPRDWP